MSRNIGNLCYLDLGTSVKYGYAPNTDMFNIFKVFMYLEILQGLYPHTMSRYMLEKKNEKSEHTHPYPIDPDPNNIASINHSLNKLMSRTKIFSRIHINMTSSSIAAFNLVFLTCHTCY